MHREAGQSLGLQFTTAAVASSKCDLCDFSFFDAIHFRSDRNLLLGFVCKVTSSLISLVLPFCKTSRILIPSHVQHFSNFIKLPRNPPSIIFKLSQSPLVLSHDVENMDDDMIVLPIHTREFHPAHE